MNLSKDQLQGTHTVGGIPTVLVKGVGKSKPHFVNEHEYDAKLHGEKIDVEAEPKIKVSGLPRIKYDDWGKPALKDKQDPSSVIMLPAEPVTILKLFYDESVHGEILEDEPAKVAKKTKAAKE